MRRHVLLALIPALALFGCTPKPAGLTPRTGMIDVPGGKVWYQVVGHGTKTPLLVLHGGPGVPHDYLLPLAALADERPVVFYDQLGCGRSPAPADSALWTIDRFVAELAAVRAALGLTRVHLLGSSWGTILAVESMKRHPEGVESLVLASPALDIPQWAVDAESLKATLPDSTRKVIDDAEAHHTTDTPAYQAAMMDYYHRYVSRRQPWSPDLDSAFAHMGVPVYTTMDGPSEFTVTGTLHDYNARAYLPQLKLPVLYTTGEFDEALPRTVASFARATPGAEMRIFANAGHVTMEDDSTEYVAVVRDFLDRADARAGRH